MNTFRTTLSLLGLLVLLVATGCDSNSVQDENTLSATSDVAESVSMLLGGDTGGLTDQLADAFILGTTGDLTGVGKSNDPIEKTYDATTGTWTITFTREFSNPTSTRSGSLHRVYEVQFLDANGQPQQFFITEGSKASSIHFVIVEGNGTFETPRLTGERTELAGDWMLTGTDTDTITINGTYSRSGGHTFTTAEATRTLDYNVSFEIQDLVGPKGSQLDIAEKISGTLTGIYEGNVTFTRGNAYREQDFNGSVTITIENGEATIDVEGDRFHTPLTGEGRFLGPPEQM
jgi:hypothetical protein